ncbi:MAG: peptide-methionine (S)-S-oxide reductase MsrA [Oceanococcus sp.]
MIAADTQVATFASGCFWCTESDFEKLDGVLSAVSGYTAGQVKDPSYKQVSGGGTGHTEAVQVRYDPNTVSYAELLQHFWHNVDPTVKDQQFCDRGSQYRSAIFYHNETQKKAALSSLAPIQKKFGKVYTEIATAETFYPAEEYHQDYYKKNPVRYRWYRSGCGRDKRLEQLWGAPAK